MKDQVYEQLKNILKNTHSHYYHYPVAAIVECSDETRWPGVNIETSSPQAGICAERNALFSALANGYQKKDIKRIYLLNETEEKITPCFICRQALVDYCNKEVEIVSYNRQGEKEIHTVGELTPYGFGEDNLK